MRSKVLTTKVTIPDSPCLQPQAHFPSFLSCSCPGGQPLGYVSGPLASWPAVGVNPGRRAATGWQRVGAEGAGVIFPLFPQCWTTVCERLPALKPQPPLGGLMSSFSFWHCVRSLSLSFSPQTEGGNGFPPLPVPQCHHPSSTLPTPLSIDHDSDYKADFDGFDLVIRIVPREKYPYCAPGGSYPSVISFLFSKMGGDPSHCTEINNGDVYSRQKVFAILKSMCGCEQWEREREKRERQRGWGVGWRLHVQRAGKRAEQADGEEDRCGKLLRTRSKALETMMTISPAGGSLQVPATCFAGQRPCKRRESSHSEISLEMIRDSPKQREGRVNKCGQSLLGDWQTWTPLNLVVHLEVKCQTSVINEII